MEKTQSAAPTAAVKGAAVGPLNADAVKWVEEAARATADFQLRCADAMEGQATTLLNLLLAGAGGALAMAVSLGEKTAPLWQVGGMWAASGWLFAVAALLVWRVLWVRQIFGPANDPKNLEPAYRMALVDVIRFDLEHRQICIEANRERNATVGRWLNICRGLATATPVVFALAAMAWAL